MNQTGPGRLARSRATERATRIAAAVVIGVSLIVGMFTALTLLLSPHYAGSPAFDFALYRDAAARWLQGGFFYYPEQLAGPYTTQLGHVMYPPIGLVLFVPFTVLPAVLWWVLPLSAIAWRVFALRPSLVGWAAITALVCWPFSIQIIVAGNPAFWIVAALALATRWPWVAVFVLLKPSLGPFALAGARTRAWWLALGLFACVSLLFLPMWFDWIGVVLNARGFFSGPLYSLNDVPLMLVPVIAWLTGRHRPGRVSGQAGCARRSQPPAGSPRRRTAGRSRSRSARGPRWPA